MPHFCMPDWNALQSYLDNLMCDNTYYVLGSDPSNPIKVSCGDPSMSITACYDDTITFVWDMDNPIVVSLQNPCSGGEPIIAYVAIEYAWFIDSYSLGIGSDGRISATNFPTIECTGDLESPGFSGTINITYGFTFYGNWPPCCDDDPPLAFQSPATGSSPGYWTYPINFYYTVPPCSAFPGGSSSFSKLLRFTDFGFQLPNEANILGIKTTIHRTSISGSQASDSIVKLMFDHKILGQNKANLDNEYIPGDFDYIYGDYDDVWNLNFSAADINDEGFGIAMESAGASWGLSSDVYLNYIQIEVNYEHNGVVNLETKRLDWDGAVYPIF